MQERVNTYLVVLVGVLFAYEKIRFLTYHGILLEKNEFAQSWEGKLYNSLHMHHSIEIISEGHFTCAVVVEESRPNFSYMKSEEPTRSGSDRMDSNNQPSMQQAAAITKAPLIVAANKAKKEINKSLAKINGSSTPTKSEPNKTYSGIHKDDLQIDTSSPISTPDDEKGGAATKDYSRRLVEYFVVVSSAPKPTPKRERVDSSGHDAIGMKNDSKSTPKQTNHKALSSDENGAAKHVPPPPSRTVSGSQITPHVAARVDKRRGHLKESFRPGESILPALTSSASNLIVSDEGDEHVESIEEGTQSNDIFPKKDCTINNNENSNLQQSGPKVKGTLLSSINEHKEKLNEQKKKLSRQASGLQHHLGTKIKSIHLGRSSKSEENVHPQDEVDDSSLSSFSNDETTQTEAPPAQAFKPSASPSTHNQSFIPSSQNDLQQREGGASENIRIENSFFNIANRELENDIEDCLLEPIITAQYPPVDRPDQPLNPMITHFCYPQGVENILPAHEYRMPKIHHFVLTDSTGGKLYGTCLTAYEEFSPGNGLHGTADNDDVSLASLREEDQERNYVECSINEPPSVRRHRRRSKNHKYYAPRVLCILSTWPYLSAFRTYLSQLYRLATTTSLMKAPLERYILNICDEVPAPYPGAFEVKLTILETDIRIWAPPADQPIPYVSVNYGVLFECLDVSNVLFAWNTLACERKLLLVSSQLSLLTICAEILCSMIFPMRWSHLYIPVLPKFLTPMLDAPMPYLCGISRENFPYAVADISDETIVVDLDRNLITMGTHTPNLPILPQRRKLKLEAALEKHVGQVFWKARGLSKASVESVRLSGDENAIEEMLGRANAVWDEQLCAMDEAFYLAHSPDSMSILFDKEDAPQKPSRWDSIQEAFLRFYVAMLKDYRKFLPSTTIEQKSWRASMMAGVDDPRFMADDFVASQRLDFQPFLRELVSTQMFDAFITRRIYNAGNEPDVTFFDQSIDAKKNRSKLRLKKTDTPFLHSANAHRVMKHINAIEPNKNDLPSDNESIDKYLYPTWPELFDESLFCAPRPIPKIITAEFDRRAALAAMLKDKLGAAEESRLSGCFNPSHEATSFLLFFAMFNQTIGRDWISFKKEHAHRLNNGSTCVAEVPSPTPWKPAVNPPWMSQMPQFQSIHQNFRPHETIVDERNEVLPYNTCCIPDCDNLCVGNVFDSAVLPWTQSNIKSESDAKRISYDEEFENELVKARSVAKAQVDLGVSVLKMMRRRKLPTETITYKSLIEACGRCGIPFHATQLIKMMTQDGLSIDSDTYYIFMKAFSHGDTDTTHYADTISEISGYAPSAVSRKSSSGNTMNRRTSFDSNATFGSRVTQNTSKFLGEINHAMTSSLEENKRAFRSAKSKSRLFKKSLTKEKDTIVTDAVRNHFDLSNCILEDIYSGLVLDANSDTCPKCSCVLSQDNIILGWKPCEVKDFSTTCPSCKHRFVPKFSVTSSLLSFKGSQGEGTPLFVDYLSPWVLLRQIRNIIDSNDKNETLSGVESIVNPKFREENGKHATLWWNIIVTFRRFKIPYTFLLQGDFPYQQLIMPTPEALDDAS